MNNLVEADILATCNALGTEVTGVYEKGVECLECLRDLLRYLRKDDENHSVLRFLGSIRLLQTDLLPLLKRYEHDDEIFDFVLRLLVALSSPALLLFKEEIPEDKLTHHVYLQLLSYLQTYKEAFTDADAWKSLSKRLQKLLEMRNKERSENENLTIERILIFTRNILHIPSDDKNFTKTDNDLSSHDKILVCLRKSKIDVSILYLCANEEERNFSLHVLEIICLMLREHSAETLAQSSAHRSIVEREEDVKTLTTALQREQLVKLKKAQSVISPRFNGVYSVKNMKSLSDNDYISHKLITNTDDVKFDSTKNFKRKPKNRLPAKDIDIHRHSTLSVRLFLKNLCKEFLKVYNKLMATVKKELLRKSSEDHDDSYYLWAIEYFMRFNRNYNFQPDFVSETISVQIFHHIQTQITNYLEMMMADKKKANFWSKRMKLGIKAYKELLKTLQAMTHSSDSNIKRNADIVISNIFYVIEYREMPLSLLSHYDEVKFPLTYLAELVESAYFFLKILEEHSKVNTEIIIQKKKRKVKRRKKKPKATEITKEIESLDDKWLKIASELSATVQGRRMIPSDISPFDGASQVDFEEQKVEAVYKIRTALLSQDTSTAVGYLRAARELWPEGDSFGGTDIESEDEFTVLREIFLSDLNDPQLELNSKAEEAESLEETDEEVESLPAVTEQKLDLNEIYNKYATHKVAIPCCLLLSNYKNNSRQTNSCLIRFLHRIAWNCKMHALFFQASVFLTFQKIFQDPDISIDPIIKEFYRFGKFIMRKFFEVAEKNNKIFVEMLFWKGNKEAYELEEGYGASDNRALKAVWTENEEEELVYLYEENKNIYIDGQDVADIILANINKKRSKLQVISALKRLGLIQSAKDLKPQLKEWQEVEIVDLQNLYEDHKNSDDIMGNILNGLSIKRSRKAVVEKLLELNLIQDRKQVLKKRSKKNKSHESESNNSSNEFDEETNQHFNSRKSRNESSDEDAEENFFKNLRTELLNVENSNVEKQDEENALSEVWDESEIIELNRLYNDNKEGKNVVDLISNLLTIKRSKRNIIQKLFELNLIKDTDELINTEGLEHNSIWDESEIIELHRLFDDSKDEKDPIEFISNLLSVKHSKKSITEKLLELGLIKELKKKKRSKTASIRDDFRNSDSDNSDEEVNNNRSFNNKTKSKKMRQILSDDSDEESFTSKSKQIKKSKLNTSSSSVLSKQSQGGKRPPKIWEEEEVIELQRLFQEHKNSMDIIGNIMSNKTIKRPKHIIIEKLLKLSLILDKKEVRKKRQSKSAKDKTTESSDDTPLSLLPQKNSSKDWNQSKESVSKKRPPKIWEEEEVIELQKLFQDHKDSTDIIRNIMSNKTIKRPKPIIIEKLLELSLIVDKKEVRKKRLSKSSKQKIIQGKTVSDSSDDDDNTPLSLLPQRDIQQNSSEDCNEQEITDLRLLNNSQKLNTSNGKDKSIKGKSKKRKILSDSSDEDSISVSNLISPNASAPIFGDDFQETDQIQTNSTNILNGKTIETLPSNENNLIVNEELGLATSRKRRRISFSDDSVDSPDFVDSNPKRQNILGSAENILNITEIVNEKESPVKEPAITSFKKRIRILDDSDESN